MSTQSLLQAINPLGPSVNMRGPVKNSGLVTVDVDTPVWFRAIRIHTTDGNVVIKNGDITYTIYNCQKAEGFIECVGNRILSTGTTAVGISWYTSD